MIELVPDASPVLQLEAKAREWVGLVRGPLLKSVAELVTEQARERVAETKRSPDLRPWPPRKSGGTHPLLVKTGRMLRSIRNRRSGVGEMVAGAARPYARHHHTGTRRGLEPRPFVGVGPQDAKEIGSLIDLFVELRF